MVTKEEKKASQLAAKEAKIQAKLVAKEERNQAKLVAKEAKKAEREIEKKQRREAIVLIRQQTRHDKMVLKEQERMAKIAAKNAAKQELKDNAFNRMRRVQSLMPTEYTVKQFCEMYIQHFGRINPYKGTPILEGDKYDLYAGIRGLLYELSPSSTQHWFQYGQQKNVKELGPWLFANKELALVNNAFEWKTSTTAQKSAQRRHKGIWTSLHVDSESTFDTNLFGPIPDKATLEQASVGRKIGRRGSGGIRNDANIVNEV